MVFKTSLFARCFALLSVAMLAGCGPVESSKLFNTRNGLDDSRYLSRFSEAEALAIFGGENPVVTYGNGSTTATPPSFSQEYGNFTVGAEVRTFIPVQNGFDESKSLIIKSNEKVSDYVKILDAAGGILYKSAVNVNEVGTVIPEQVTGQAPVEGKNIFASVVTLSGGREARSIMRTNVADNNGVIKVFTVNQTDIKVKIVFDITVIKAGDTISKTEYYPYKNGYLVYSGTKALGASSTISNQMNSSSLTPSIWASLNYTKNLLK